MSAASVDVALHGGARNVAARRAPSRAVLAGTFVAWLVPVALTVLGGSASVIEAAALVASCAAFAVTLRDPQHALVVIPFLALLSPMTGFLDVLGVRVVPSDIFFILLALQSAVLVSTAGLFSRAPASRPHHLAVVLVAYLLACAVGLVTATLTSAKPLLYVLQLAILEFYTARYAREPRAWATVLRAWIAATALGCVVLLHAYLTRKPLDDLKGTGEVQAIDALASLFRATYYYSGFHYIIGACIVFLAMRALMESRASARAVQLGTLALLVVALTAMVAKTAMVAVLVATVAGALVLRVRFRAEIGRKLRRVVLAGAVLLLAGLFAMPDRSDDVQAELVLGRMSSFSSLLVRLEVYDQALRSWLSSPLHTVLGFGPDFLDNSGDRALADAFVTSSVTGYAEGTLDSGWLSYLVELGIAGFVALALAFRASVSNAVRAMRDAHALDEGAWATACLAAGLVFLGVALCTQMLGYTKTAWLPFQLLVMARPWRRP